MRSQNAGLGLKGSSYGASSSDSYRDKLKKLVCSLLFYTFAENIIVYVSSDVVCENSIVSKRKVDMANHDPNGAQTCATKGCTNFLLESVLIRLLVFLYSILQHCLCLLYRHDHALTISNRCMWIPSHQAGLGCAMYIEQTLKSQGDPPEVEFEKAESWVAALNTSTKNRVKFPPIV